MHLKERKSHKEFMDTVAEELSFVKVINVKVHV